MGDETRDPKADLRIPGEPLGDQPLTRAQLAGLGEAMNRLYRSVPSETLADVPEWYRGDALLAVAARVGTTRLIDNVPLVIGP